MDPAHYAGLFRPGPAPATRHHPAGIRPMAPSARSRAASRRHTPSWSRRQAPDDDATARSVMRGLPSAAPLSSGDGPAHAARAGREARGELRRPPRRVLTREVGAKTQKHLAMRVAMFVPSTGLTSNSRNVGGIEFRAELPALVHVVVGGAGGATDGAPAAVDPAAAPGAGPRWREPWKQSAPARWRRGGL